ncbi:hypothetical protein JOC86_004540 [Bacillus pakistanensis]|uniref:NERD domain-containing protein n=1 Tax=Rossellomorea pakistanensis TaxID=992288 RepID=A0ABS2NJH8_9BACI|nr:nuclease-related domain-containing protein [Bacillus pakistanensis]MBM7587965.1 hypothetical protein [Bacillus pakistanensis]
MIVKPRDIPLSIMKLKALKSRLPHNHPKISKINEALVISLAGLKGENSIDFPLSFLTDNKYLIFHDLRLEYNQYYFQIDTLLVSKSHILIIEVKNIAGTIYFDQEFNQMIRVKDGIEEAFADPLIQVQRHETQLKSWLKKKNFLISPFTH